MHSRMDRRLNGSASSQWSYPDGGAVPSVPGVNNGKPVDSHGAAAIGDALNVIESVNPALAATIGSSIGATGPGNPNGVPGPFKVGLVDGQGEFSGMSSNDGFYLDFGGISGPLEGAVTLIHEHAHATAASASGSTADPNTDVDTIGADLGVSGFEAELVSCFQHQGIEANAFIAVYGACDTAMNCPDLQANCESLALFYQNALAAADECSSAALALQAALQKVGDSISRHVETANNAVLALLLLNPPENSSCCHLFNEHCQ